MNQRLDTSMKILFDVISGQFSISIHISYSNAGTTHWHASNLYGSYLQNGYILHINTQIMYNILLQ